LEWVGPGMDIKMGFHKVAPYYYTGWHEPASEMQFLINKRAWKRLPDNYKQMLITAMKAVSADMYYENFAMSANAWAKIKTDYPNIKVKTFPKPVLQAMYNATQEVLQSYASKNKLFAEIWANQKAWMKKARPWSMMSEYYYLKASQEVQK
ncbi:MAG: ABC transporter substrate-binding protein, partial [Epsilonproteobacteria bacterium]|nr:ABC transporter substrate-binding protein [Campylobacterota bacterium]